MKQMHEGVTVQFKQERFSIKDLAPSDEEIKRVRIPVLRSSVLGFVTGLLPGAGGTTAAFMAYAMEKRLSKRPEEFGKGAPEGVASVEAANNAAAFGAMVPLLTLGIPGSGTTAVMLGGLIMWGLRPGPLLVREQPDLFWGLVGALVLMNAVLLMLNLLFIPAFVWSLKVLSPYLEPLVAVLCVIGVYGVNNRLSDVWLMLVAGLFGYYLKRANYPIGPLILAAVLGPMAEGAFRQSLIISRGSFAIFFTRPISACLLGAAFAIWGWVAVQSLLARRRVTGKAASAA